ncbi:MAG: hypothetical protein IPP11_11680 [Chitinophagaceae bacterium]|nr:hypothetical protein [Chitinophagaceae bacterium]
MAASVIGTGRGALDNVVSLLPIEEAEILLDSNSSTADKWGALFSGISKAANIAAMGAAGRNFNPMTGETGTVGYGLAGPKGTQGLGSFLKGHGAVTFDKIFFDKNGPSTVRIRKIDIRPDKYHIDRRLFNGREDWNGGNFGYTDVKVPKSLFDRALRSAQSRFNKNQNLNGQEGFNIGLNNCSQFAGEMLSKAGLEILSSFPKLAQMNMEKVPFLGGTAIKSAITNSAIQQTEKKK